MTTIRLALFDLDDTLLDHRGAVSRGIRTHVAALGSAYAAADENSVALWHSLEEKHYHRYLSGELSFAEQRRARALDFTAAHGVSLTDGAADVWFDTYFLSYQNSWQLFTDALPCLDAVEGMDIRVGVITNGEADYQRVKLERTGLVDRFDHVVASGALGIAKPEPEIFEHACSLYGVAPEEALYVGDRLATDAVGAARAGLTGVWLNRHGDAVPAGAIGHGSQAHEDAATLAAASGVFTIASLDELAGLLER